MPTTPTSPASPLPKKPKTNPLNDLIDTEKVYVDNLTGIIRVRLLFLAIPHCPC